MDFEASESHYMMQERRLSAWTVAGTVVGLWFVASPVLAADYARKGLPLSWRVVQEGLNRIAVILEEGGPATVQSVDLALP